MNNEEIIAKMEVLFRKELNNDSITLSEATTANEIEEWDSLTHIQLIVSVEKLFKVRFKSKEIQSWKNVGEWVNCISEKL